MRARAYNDLLRLARRHSRRGDEAEDLLQDALLDAVAAGRADLGDTSNRRWLAGVIRNRAAMAARGAARRLRRDTLWQREYREAESNATAAEIGEVLRDLPPALKAVAALALSGHSRREVAYLLRLGDAALRQRVVALKRQLANRGIPMPALTSGLNLELSYGRIRDALLPKLVREGGVFASHDPDGHLFDLTECRSAATQGYQSQGDKPVIPKPHRASIVFYVADIARTEKFYTEVLGIELTRMEGAEPFWLSGTLDGGPDLVFFEMEGVRGNTPALVFDIAEGGIDDVVAALVAQGVTIVTPVSEAPGGWSADFLDPDGFGLGLYQSGEKPRSRKA